MTMQIDKPWVVVSQSGVFVSNHMTDVGAADDMSAASKRNPGVRYFVVPLRPVMTAICPVGEVVVDRVKCERR